MNIPDFVRKSLAHVMPRPEKFFRLLREQSGEARKISPLLRTIADQGGSDTQWASVIQTIEEECDTRTRAIHEELQIQFITPIDREDINSLTRVIDDAVDLLEEGVSLIADLNFQLPKNPDDELLQLIKTAATSIELVDQAVNRMEGFKDITTLRNAMRTCEHAADALYKKAQSQEYTLDVAELLVKCDTEQVTVKDVKIVLDAQMYERKRASIARRFEDAIDNCKHVFDVLGNVYLKYT